MTEVLIEASETRKPPKTTMLVGSTLVLVGRAVALVMALFLIRAAILAGPTVFSSAQPIAIATLLIAAAFARRSTSTMLTLGYVFMFLSFLLLRPIADETFIPVNFDYPILADRVMFLGSLPMVWLQDLLYVPGRITPFDFVLSSVYITYFVAPHLTAIVVWRTRPWLFPKAIVAISLTFTIGLFFYFLVPTAPPWLASDTGDIDSNVVRILPEIISQLAGDTYDEASRAVGLNDVAAMPSLHTALTCTIALIMASYGRAWRWVGITYLALMGTALVYLGEHYVIDEIAGIALAIGVWKLVSEHRMFAGLSRRPESEDEKAVDLTAESRAA